MWQHPPRDDEDESEGSTSGVGVGKRSRAGNGAKGGKDSVRQFDRFDSVEMPMRPVQDEIHAGLAALMVDEERKWRACPTPPEQIRLNEVIRELLMESSSGWSRCARGQGLIIFARAMTSLAQVVGRREAT